MQAATSINATGQVTHVSPYGATLWVAADMAHWQMAQVFTNHTSVSLTSAQKFFRVVPRTGPATVNIVDTRQTLRGRCNKIVTNLTLTGESGTYTGWVEFRNLPNRSNDSFYVQWRFPSITNCTNVTLRLTDCDGFLTVTTLVINPLVPSDYSAPPLPANQKRKAAPFVAPPPPVGFVPASDPSRSAGEWWVVAHNISQTFEQVSKAGRTVFQNTEGITGPGACDLTFIRKEWQGTTMTKDCQGIYAGAGNWAMYLASDSGSCYYPPSRIYTASAEFASYSDTSTWWPAGVASERLTWVATSAATLFVGNWNTGSNALIRVGYNFSKMVERYTTEVYFELIAPPVATVGNTGRSPNDYIVVSDDSYLDVTPNINTSGDWLQYEVTFERIH